ncbi:LOW QUALITY PROTEIN: nucleic acid dioxygenase ALKBH1 [Pristis pectinata]|uniref:LOW QUALITY PROTEIN: nucleic acid dioxygenase ALKBH1 n=1 Tax=Pristis pectinata TaxID=685728 RepID=UPI00223CA4E2|nr:LOW QUALITY PROTEIN: nucleic acid dioxygenase ALKBH1 [Pristis pectinata]
MAAGLLEQGEDAFRRLFKYYKRRRPPPDFSTVLDFSRAEKNLKVQIAPLNAASVNDKDACKAGLQPVSKWKAYTLAGYPGFMFISDPFLPGWQCYWAKQCLKTYPRKPNVCNLDLHMSPEETKDLWEQSREQLRLKTPGKREAKSLLEKLRWVTLGYHYNWETKKYSPDHYTTFPVDLAYLSEQVAAACGFHQFKAEAGILNYYHFDSSLGIHVDESEMDYSKPLLSISFGQSAVFLLGGRKRQDPPLPMYMHSGDIMIMSGSSRLLYHAVPRIVPNLEGGRLPSCLEHTTTSNNQHSDEGDWEACAKYLETSRVNMTVRQVLEVGQSFPVESDSEKRRRHPAVLLSSRLLREDK